VVNIELADREAVLLLGEFSCSAQKSTNTGLSALMAYPVVQRCDFSH
jgi:hypothetical protein